MTIYEIINNNKTDLSNPAQFNWIMDMDNCIAYGLIDLKEKIKQIKALNFNMDKITIYKRLSKGSCTDVTDKYKK